MALRVAKHYTELIEQGRLTEAEGELEKAAELYEQAIRQNPLEEFPFNRLMVIYRKFRQYDDELKVINKGLHLFQQHYDKKPQLIMGKNAKALQLSKSLLKSLNGNKKIAEPYYPEPIPRWTKRKEVVEKRLGK